MALKYHAGRRVQGLSTDNLSPPTLEENYTTNTGWTQVGSTITINSGISGKLSSINTLDNTITHVHKSLGVTLSDSLWIADFEFQRDSAGCNSFAWFVSAGTTFIIGSTQDSIGINLDGADVRSFAQNGASRTFGTSISSLATSTNYFIRLERTSTTNVKLSVFTDSARTTHLSGSPVNQTIPSDIIGLTHLQHSGRNDGGGSPSSFRIDNTQIYNTITNKPTNVQLGSRFEETDTRKINFLGNMSKTNCKAYYKFEETSGNLINQATTANGFTDGLGTGADLIVVGATYAQTGKIGNAVSFDGVNDYAYVSNNSLTDYTFLHAENSLFTINFWYKLNNSNPGSYHPIFGTGAEAPASGKGALTLNFEDRDGVGNLQIRLQLSYNLLSLISTEYTADNFLPNDTNWHMLTLRWDENGSSQAVKIQVDNGTPTYLARSGNTGGSGNQVGKFTLASWISGTFFINSQFDEFSIWNRRLSDEEITSLYNSGSGALIENIKLWSAEV